MRIHTVIITLLLATTSIGCGIKEEEHQRVLTELDETKQALKQAQSEIDETKQALKQAQSTVDRLKKQETYTFSAAGALFDAGNLSGALQAYTAFIRDFPSSPKIPAAKAQISLIKQRQETQRKKNEERQLAEKLRTGGLTVPQLVPYLRGKTKEEVIDLLGTPRSVLSQGTTLVWDDKAYSTITKKKDDLLIIFSKNNNKLGRMVWVSGEDSHSLH